MKRLPSVYLALSVTLIAVVTTPRETSAAAPVHIWSNGYTAGGASLGKAVVEDPSGNVFLAGDFRVSIDFGGGELTGANFADVFLVKLDADGNHLWSLAFGGTLFESAEALSADSKGNIVIVGSFESIVDFGDGPVTSAGLSDGFVAKFAPNGSLVWVNTFGSSGFDIAVGVTVDASDDIIVTGEFHGSVDFGLGALTSAGGYDIFMVKYDEAGNTLLNQRYGSIYHDYATEIRSYGLGDLVLVGSIESGADLGGGALTTAGDHDAFVANYNSNFVHRWSVLFGGPSDDFAESVALDLSGGVYVAGWFQDSADFGGGLLSSAGGTDIFLVKLVGMGTHAWSQSFGSTGNDMPREIGCDLFGNTTMVGYLDGAASLGGDLFPHVDRHELFIAGYDPDGIHRWSRVESGVADDETNGVCVSLEGQVLATGRFFEPQDLGGGPLTQFLGSTFVVKYRAATVEPFLLSIEDVGNDQGGWVQITFQRTIYDEPGSLLPIQNYEAYRRIDPIPGKMAGWDYVGVVPAIGDESYSLIASTLADSTVNNGIHWSVFSIRATTADPELFIDAPPDSGYSVDNIAPGVPTGFAAAYAFDAVDLSWDPAPEPDVQYYRIYRDTDSAFEPSPANLVQQVGTSSWTDSSASPWSFHYKVSAVDLGGNEGEAAEVQTATDSPQLSRRFALHEANPNPFNPSTMIAFDLPAAARVRLSIYDVSGRLVKQLLNEMRDGGRNSATWNGKDDRGNAVSSGVFYYRLVAESFTDTKRMVLVK